MSASNSGPANRYKDYQNTPEQHSDLLTIEINHKYTVKKLNTKKRNSRKQESKKVLGWSIAEKKQKELWESFPQLKEAAVYSNEGFQGNVSEGDWVAMPYDAPRQFGVICEIRQSDATTDAPVVHVLVCWAIKISQAMSQSSVASTANFWNGWEGMSEQDYVLSSSFQIRNIKEIGAWNFDTHGNDAQVDEDECLKGGRKYNASGRKDGGNNLWADSFYDHKQAVFKLGGLDLKRRPAVKSSSSTANQPESREAASSAVTGEQGKAGVNATDPSEVATTAQGNTASGRTTAGSKNILNSATPATSQQAGASRSKLRSEQSYKQETSKKDALGEDGSKDCGGKEIGILGRELSEASAEVDAERHFNDAKLSNDVPLSGSAVDDIGSSDQSDAVKLVESGDSTETSGDPAAQSQELSERQREKSRAQNPENELVIKGKVNRFPETATVNNRSGAKHGVYGHRHSRDAVINDFSIMADEKEFDVSGAATRSQAAISKQSHRKDGEAVGPRSIDDKAAFRNVANGSSAATGQTQSAQPISKPKLNINRIKSHTKKPTSVRNTEESHSPAQGQIPVTPHHAHIPPSTTGLMSPPPRRGPANGPGAKNVAGPTDTTGKAPSLQPSNVDTGSPLAESLSAENSRMRPSSRELHREFVKALRDQAARDASRAKRDLARAMEDAEQARKLAAQAKEIEAKAYTIEERWSRVLLEED